MPVANARMYSATPAAKQAWKDLLGWVLREARLDWGVVDYDAPAPLTELWARADLGAAMMCGLPYSQRRPRPQLVAAPLPSPARYGGKAVYFTDIVVRADSPAKRLEDTFGGVVGYTLEDSMSGCAALRRQLLAHRNSGEAPLYKAVLGGLIHARGVIEALAAGRIDVGPLDSYFHDLLRAGDPGFASRVRVLASTPAAPIPPLVATVALAAAELDRLRAAFLAVGGETSLAAQRSTLLLSGFAVPEAGDYDVFGTILAESSRYPGLW